MKSLFGLALLTITVSSFACPDLSGRYVRCVTPDMKGVPQFMIVKNDLKSKTYTITSKYADTTELEIEEFTVGVTKTSTDEGGMVSITDYSCEGSKLLVDIVQADSEWSGRTTGSVEKVNNKLVINMTLTTSEGNFDMGMVCE